MNLYLAFQIHKQENVVLYIEQFFQNNYFDVFY